MGISRWSSTDSSMVEAWETKARKEAKGQDPYQAFRSKNHDVGVRMKHVVWGFEITISIQSEFIYAIDKY